MQHDWILDVLADLKTFAQNNCLPGLAEQLDDTRHMALAEISVSGLRAGIHRAAAIAGDAERTEAARRLVRERFTVDAMAGALARIYAPPEDVETPESAA